MLMSSISRPRPAAQTDRQPSCSSISEVSTGSSCSRLSNGDVWAGLGALKKYNDAPRACNSDGVDLETSSWPDGENQNIEQDRGTAVGSNPPARQLCDENENELGGSRSADVTTASCSNNAADKNVFFEHNNFENERGVKVDCVLVGCSDVELDDDDIDVASSLEQGQSRQFSVSSVVSLSHIEIDPEFGRAPLLKKNSKTNQRNFTHGQNPCRMCEPRIF